MQLALNDWFSKAKDKVSASAFCQARLKIKHTAFIELLEKAVLEVMYSDGDYEKFRGHRLLALDGSTLRIPDTAETRKEFGFVPNMNAKGSARGGQVEAKMTVLYDVLNRVPLSAGLDRGRTSDLKASRTRLTALQPRDLILADRGFASYQFFCDITEKQADFVVRCRERLFVHAHRFSSDATVNDVVATIKAPSAIKKIGKSPESLRVRFVRIELPSGELEILATSLLDKKRYPRSLFKALYFKRWQVETFFSILKSRLSIDNFSGRSVEVIYQDFHSTIFVSGLEAVITGEAEEELSSKESRYKQKVNKAISFHAIKSSVIRLIFNQPPNFQEQIRSLFVQNPTLIRPDKIQPPRPHTWAAENRRSLYFQLYRRKHVF